MPRGLATTLSTFIVIAVPLILLGNALWALLIPWFVDAQYALPGFPLDRDGVQEPLRTELAKTGVASVRPGSDGISLLEEARLANGEAAFERKEISHMADIRGLVSAILTAWVVALACAVGAGLALARLVDRAALGRALRVGAWLTIAAMGVFGLVMAVAFDAFFNAFHGVFFEGDSWRFDERFTLRQLYPDRFWSVAGATLAALVLLQAAIALLLARQWGGGVRRRESSARLRWSVPRRIDL